jgi:dTDP-4-dehydrorhamnose reductase
MRKFLLIGSDGLLGTAFQQLLNPAELTAVNQQQFDITQAKVVIDTLNTLKPDFVINCSAYTNVDLAETEPDKAYQINAQALQLLAETCNKYKTTLIHFSTGMVFPGLAETGYNENSPTSPINVYGQSKVAGEQIIINTAISYYIIRTTWLYGPTHSANAKKNFVQMMVNLGKSGTAVGVIDEIGHPTYSLDLATAVLQLIDAKSPTGIYHLTNNGYASRYLWAQEIYQQLQMTVTLTPVSGKSFPRPAVRPQFEILNNTKTPKPRSWQLALKDYLHTL